MKGFNPIVRFPDCDIIKRICYKDHVESKIPINRELRMLELQKTPRISDVTPEWFQRNKTRLSAMLDLESNGTEITEIGIIIYNKYRIVWIFHRVFKTRSETLPGLERFIHDPVEEPTEFFNEVRKDIVSVLNSCQSIVVKGRQLESQTFPELRRKMIDLNVVDSFPKIDTVEGRKLVTAFEIIKPYLMLTKNQSMGIVDVSELRHNPLIECYIFWYILNNINPRLLYAFMDLFNFEKLHILI